MFYLLVKVSKDINRIKGFENDRQKHNLEAIHCQRDRNFSWGEGLFEVAHNRVKLVYSGSDTIHCVEDCHVTTPLPWSKTAVNNSTVNIFHWRRARYNVSRSNSSLHQIIIWCHRVRSVHAFKVTLGEEKLTDWILTLTRATDYG